MELDSLGEVYTLSDIASATDSTEEEVRAAAGGSQPFWSHRDAVRIGRLVIAERYEAATRSQALLFALPGRGRTLLSGSNVPLVFSASFHVGALTILLVAFSLAPNAAAPSHDAQNLAASRLVFLVVPGPGGGGGGGGARERHAPPKAELHGQRSIPSPAMASRPGTLPAEQLPALIAPIITAQADARDRAGLIEQAIAEADSRGGGIGGGIGSGAGSGNGQGDGPGIGVGSGGGFGGGAYRPGSGISAPRLLREIKADYTEDARRRGLTGEVVLEIVVRSDGSVGDIRLLQGLGAGLNDRAITAVRQWRFSPAERQGTPVDVVVEVGVEFRLR